MPLAVIRKVASDLPLIYARFRFDGDGARRDYLVGCQGRDRGTRVSTSGTAAPTSGDLAGESGPVTPGASGVVVTINRIVP